jgi:hypothetical protein
MNFICGSTPIASTLQTGTGHRGSLNLTVPFVIYGEKEIMSTLSLSGNTKIKIPMEISETVNIPVTFSQITKDSVNLSFSLSAMLDDTVLYRIPSPLSIEGGLRSENVLSEKVSDTVGILGSIGDFTLNGCLNVSRPMNRNDLCGSLKIPLPDSDGILVKDELAVYADGKDITASLTKAEIELFGRNTPSTADIYLKQPMEAEEIRIELNGYEYSFRTASCLKKESSTKIHAEADFGRGRKHISISNKKALHAVSEFSSLIWSGNNFLIADINGDYSISDFASQLAESSSGYVKTSGTNIAICSKYGTKQKIETDNIFSWELRRTEKRDNITVNYGRGADDGITIEADRKTSKKVNTIDVYALSGIEIFDNTGNYYEPVSEEQVSFTEYVLFENGEGKLSKPALAMQTPDVDFQGKTVYSTSLMMPVTYQTLRKRYAIPSGKDVKKTIYAKSENSISIVSDPYAENKKITDNIINDYASAFRRAQQESIKEVMKIETLHLPQLNSPYHSTIKTPFGSGDITSAKIIVDTEPTKITNILEVELWKK